MIRIILFSLLFLSNVRAWTQLEMSSCTKADWSQLIAICGKPINADDPLIQRYPVYRLNNGWYVSLAGRLRENPDWSVLTDLGVLKGAESGGVATMKVPVGLMSSLDFSAVYDYIEIPSKVFPDLERVRKDVRADSVQYGLGLPEAYTGKDVLIGITDWGFDYTHPTFYDTLLQSSRVVAAWDQYRHAGDLPAGYNYGVEFDTPGELMTAGSDTANIYSFHTHGTHVAGIAGGSGAGLPYRGMAPEAGFLFTTFLIDYASVIDGIAWMKQKADDLDKRLVVNMSWGLYYMGTLDGNSLLSQALDAFSDQGVVFVASAGNNGDSNFHIRKTFAQDEMLTRINFDSSSPSPYYWGQSVTMWGEVGQPFSIELRMHSNINVLLLSSPVYNTSDAPAYIDSMLVFDGDTLYYNLTTESSHPQNGRPHMRLRVRTTNYFLKIGLVASAPSGTVHFWNVAELTTGVGNWGASFTALGFEGIAGDANYSIGEPTCTASVISVAAYESSYTNGSGNPAGGELAYFSSIGPLMTEAMKPDIAAPGYNVVSAASSFSDYNYTVADQVVFNDLEYDFTRMSGTSMSSPCVAGIAALILDANPDLTSQQVKEIIMVTAREDQFTGDIQLPGDTRWGRGKINAYAAVQLALQTEIGVHEEDNSLRAMIMPNPAHDRFKVILSGDEFPVRVAAVDMSGRRISLDVDNGIVGCPELAPGIYIIEITDGVKTGYTRFIRQ